LATLSREILGEAYFKNTVLAHAKGSKPEGKQRSERVTKT